MGRIDQPGKLGLGLVDIDGSHGRGPTHLLDQGGEP